jgi:hypothetical protein
MKKEELMYKHFGKIQRGEVTKRQVLSEAEVRAGEKNEKLIRVHSDF